ncbi:MAG: flavin reductase family protein [Ruminococcaceae bacterium]|nr:flavin reductase family protein [Oscillospiraceae bacterium]
MAKVNWKGGALLAPVPPVLVTVGNGEKSNVFTVAWTGLINTVPPKTYISVRPSRYSYDFIKESGEFVLNLTPSSLIRAADWCGIHTGRKADKFAKWSLTRAAANEVSVPIIEECPLSLECRVFDIIELGSHHMFLADIVCVDVDAEIIDKEGRLHIERAGLAAFAHGEYFELGRSLGRFGFSVKKKKKHSQKR